MKQQRKFRFLILLMIWALLSSGVAQANICGTDYQNFNPTTGGLDFVTVHSSETLKPCILNTGLFMNYSKNTLTYTKDYNNNFAGEKVNDSMLGFDLNAGVGLGKDWDAGINLQFVAASDVKNPYYTSYFKKNGLADIKLNTKYRLLGDASGGLAFIGSINLNQISDNPYTGTNPGPTFNFELAADTTLSSSWALGVNLGYRKRNPGGAVANVPFSPLKDQFIYSAAASFLISSLDTKFIAEIVGARPVQEVEANASARSQSSLEMLLGLKTMVTHETALHLGGGTNVQSGTATPDYRVYVGFNWMWGPFCDTREKKPKRSIPPPPPRKATALSKPLPDTIPVPEIDEAFDGFKEPPRAVVVETPEYTLVRIGAEVLFDFNSDQIRKSSYDDLDLVHRHIKKNGFERLIIEGHTDSIGNDAYNLDLSRRRARQVSLFLIGRHSDLPPDKVEAVGYGETRPVADNGNYQGRQENRRVEFKIYRKDSVQERVIQRGVKQIPISDPPGKGARQ